MPEEKMRRTAFLPFFGLVHEVIAVHRDQRRQVVIRVGVDLHHELALLRRDATVSRVINLTTRVQKELLIWAKKRRQSLQHLEIRQIRLKRRAIRRHLLVVNHGTRR